MPIVLGGNKPNLSNNQILKIIIDKLKSAWAINNPPVDDPNEFKNVHFNTDWYDNAHDYVISVLLNADIMGAAALGNKAWDHSLFIEIHTFCRELSEQYPETMTNLNKEVSRIISTSVGGFPAFGISLIVPINFKRIDEEDNTSTIFHSMMTIQVILTKFVIPS